MVEKWLIDLLMRGPGYKRVGQRVNENSIEAMMTLCNICLISSLMLCTLDCSIAHDYSWPMFEPKKEI